MKKIISYMMLCVVGLATIGCPLAEEAVPARPTTHYVLDQTNTLSTSEIQKIDGVAKDIETSKKVSFAVLVVSSTKGEDIAPYAFRVAESWKPGVDGVGKGALLVVAKDDKKFRMEVSRNLEGELPDAATKHILDEAKPHFKRGEFGEGIFDILRSAGAKVADPNKVVVAAVEMPTEEPSLSIFAIVSLFGSACVAFILLYVLKSKHDRDAEARRNYLLNQQRVFDSYERTRVNRQEQERLARSALAISAVAAGSMAAPLAFTKSNLDLQKPKTVSHPTPKPAPRPTSVKKEEPRRSSSRSNYEADTVDFSPSYSSRSSSSSDSGSSSSSSSSWSSSSSSDYGGGGSSSSWD